MKKQMLLCLDIGNTHILGGVFDDDKLVARFRYATHLIGTADQFGIFLLNILQASRKAFPLNPSLFNKIILKLNSPPLTSNSDND